MKGGPKKDLFHNCEKVTKDNSVSTFGGGVGGEKGMKKGQPHGWMPAPNFRIVLYKKNLLRNSLCGPSNLGYKLLVITYCNVVQMGVMPKYGHGIVVLRGIHTRNNFSLNFSLVF